MLKTTLGVIAGVLIGAVSMALYHRQSHSSPSLEDAMAPAHTEELARLQEKISSLEGVLAGQGKAREPLVVASGKNPETPAPSTNRTPQAEPSLEVFTEQFRERTRQRTETRNAARMATLAQRLNLSPEQEEKVRALLARKASTGSDPGNRITVGAAMEGELTASSVTLNGSGSDAGNADDFDAALAPLLDDTQRGAYASLQKEERRDQVEAEANEQLARLQRMLTLTDAQKDAAFLAFTEIAREQQESTDALSDGFAGTRSRRVEALRNILSPEQAKVYETSPQFLILGEGGAGIGATLEIHLDKGGQHTPSDPSP